MLDQALALLRHASATQWLRGVTAGLPMAAVLLALYVLVHVLGTRPPLAVFGLLCALAYWLRFRALSHLSRELFSALSPRTKLGARAAALGVFNTAMVAGIGSWFWALALLAAAQSSLTLLLVCFPLMCARGALAPSLLARSACAQESGLQALARASADTRGHRHLFLGVELLALLGLLLVFGNLYALTALVLLVASSVLGLDVGFVTALIAPDNEIVPLLLLGVAALALEPLRAAISCVAFQHARERWEGGDLQAAITQLALQPRSNRSLLVLLVLCAPTLVRAEPPDLSADDARARDKAKVILARAEFLPSDTDTAEGTWQKWLLERVRERESPDRDASAPPRFELRLPPSVLILGSSVLMLGVGFWLTRSVRRRKARTAAAARASAALPTRDERLEEASRLAAQAEYELGLRSLYAVCLNALGRFDSAETNGQVVQRIQSLPLRAAFASFTQVFEPCCYGQQPATQADFERARALTDQILRAADEVPS